MGCVLVAMTIMVTILSGSAIATSAEDGRRIVTFRGIDLTTLPGYLTALGLVTASGSTVVHKLKFINALAIKLPLSNMTGALLSLLLSPYVLEVSEDPLGAVDPIIPSLAPLVEGSEWGIEWIEVLEIRRRWPELRGAGVEVAVLDTGIDPDHPDLNIGRGYNAIWAGQSPNDDFGHGTHMAGIIGAKLDGQGIGGVAPLAKVVPVKVLNENGSGHLSDLLRGMQWVYDDTNIRLANMSLQFRDNYRALEQATKRLYERGVIMVAAAGNYCSSGPPDEGGAAMMGGTAMPRRSTSHTPPPTLAGSLP